MARLAGTVAVNRVLQVTFERGMARPQPVADLAVVDETLASYA